MAQPIANELLAGDELSAGGACALAGARPRLAFRRWDKSELLQAIALVTVELADSLTDILDAALLHEFANYECFVDNFIGNKFSDLPNVTQVVV